MKFGFFGTEYTGDIGDNFCCMSHGFPDTEITAPELRLSEEYEGKTVYGTYDDVLMLAEKLGDKVKAAIVFVNSKGGENEFLSKLSTLISCPIVGGTAARSDNPRNLPVVDIEAGAFFITEEGVTACAEFKNVHSEIIEECEVEFSDPRVLDKINGEDAVEYLKRKKAERGLDELDFEHMTLSTLDGVNNHMNKNDGVHIRSGRDLEPKMLLRYISPDDAQASVSEYFDDENAIVFGCAGLRGILSSRFEGKGFGAFLFGEIVTVDDRGDFGNLMLSKLYLSRQK